MDIAEINTKITVPEADTTTPVKPEEAQTIYDLIQKYEIERTLEIGFAYGRSASYIMAATGKPHIALDPFQDHYQNLGVANIKKLGLSDQLELIRDFSHHVLPQFITEKRHFDFIFIDGDHKFDGIFIDFYFSDFLIKKGGFLLFHDTWMRSTQLVLQFIRTNRKDYREIALPNNNMTLFEKIADTDDRDGMHFREFYTTRSYLKHHSVMHMYENPNGKLRKMWLLMKKVFGR
ncbi:MAG: class I SAM-dependent methyltransferase [Owenweeksia sp.]|nr:class I SAM-dependent methyltransferase [Owenweeksia sp.]